MGRPKKGELPKPRKRPDGRYEVRLSIDGQIRSFYGDTAGQATTHAIQGKADYDAGVNRLGGRATLRQWADKQILLSANRSNLSTYKHRIDYFADSPVGKLPIIKIKYSDMQVLVNKLSEDGKKERTVSRYIHAIRDVFDVAMLDRSIATNPCVGLRIPQNTSKNKKRMPIDANQIDWIVNTDHYAQLPSMLMLYGGLRRGEVTALTWADIDLENRVIHITKSYDYKDNTLKDPKTEAGIRDVHICTILADYLIKRTPQNYDGLVVQKKVEAE